MQSPNQLWLQDNLEWVNALCGQLGAESQRHSHVALANYLYVVGFNCLRMHQDKIALLSSFADEELATLAEEFVQDFLVRLTVNQYARLKTYRGEGGFRAWAAVGLRRMISKELQKKSWQARERLSDEKHESIALPVSLDHLPVRLSLEQCLQSLTERERLIFLRRVDHEEAAQAIAEELGTTANAINILFMRVKRKLRSCLEEQGIHTSYD